MPGMYHSRAITNAKDPFAYSVCTFVTDSRQYTTMLDSFVTGGFSDKDCEYLHIDNTECNKYDAYAGINKFLTVAKGTYVIVCHQDILLLQDGRSKLDSLLKQLSQLDPMWGLCGNAGGICPGKLAIRVSDPRGDDQYTLPLPARVSSLDENFIVIRRDANLATSADVHGFHLYGSDLCAIAHILGYNAYVIDFHLRHQSSGQKDRAFYSIRNKLISKYSRALRARTITTTTTVFFLGKRGLVGRILNSDVCIRVVQRVSRIFFEVLYRRSL